MDTKELAKKLLNIRQNVTSLSERQAAIRRLDESEQNFALKNRWVIPDTINGTLDVTSYPIILNEIFSKSGNYIPSRNKPATENCMKESARRATIEMARHSNSGQDIRENISLTSVVYPTTGITNSVAKKDSNGKSYTPIKKVNPNDDKDEIPIGEPVVVSDSGKSYTAKIKSKNPDGTYSLSFEGSTGNISNRNFKRSEIGKININK